MRNDNMFGVKVKFGRASREYMYLYNTNEIKLKKGDTIAVPVSNSRELKCVTVTEVKIPLIDKNIVKGVNYTILSKDSMAILNDRASSVSASELLHITDLLDEDDADEF